MKRFAAVTVTLLSLAACSDGSVAPLAPPAPLPAKGGSDAAVVSTSADAGPGSLREAVVAASADPSIRTIRFDGGLGAIELQAPVTYSGVQSIEIRGAGVVVDGSALGALEGAIVLAGGGDVGLSDLTVREAPGVGISVLVAAGATGTVNVTLDEVHALDNGLHGVLINDQAEYLNDPATTSSAGSPAALRVRVSRSSFERNGFAAIDQDGLRVNEGGSGDLDAEIRDTRVVGNGGDGIELDERGEGSAIFAVAHTVLNENGAFTEEDYDDGIDVDESGPGEIDGRFVDVTANGNYEQGVDLNENDAGDLRVTMNQVEASDNAEEGVEFEEDDDFAGGGDIVAQLQNVTTLRNGASDGDAGLKLREKGAGSIVARLVNPVSSSNEIGGILVREDAAGDLTAVVVNATANANGDDGIGFDENGAGNLDAQVQRATASTNAGAGVAAEQAASGTGLLRIHSLDGTGNGDGTVKADPGVVVEQVPIS